MQWILLVIAYLIGSIPFSLIVGKLVKGVDIRDYGSGNVGTTNAMRVLGKKWGIIIFIFDVLKGGLVIFLIQVGVFRALGIPNEELFHPLIYGIMSAVGHIFPVFLKFKGGKAVATSVGIFLFYAPVLGVVGLLGFVLGVKLTRYVSVGSCLGASTLLITTWIIYFFGPSIGSNWVYVFGPERELWMPISGLIGNALIFYRHRKNFKNIKNGVEPKASWLNKKRALKDAE